MTACCHIVNIVFLCECNDSEKQRFELTCAAFSFYHIKADFTPQDSQKLTQKTTKQIIKVLTMEYYKSYISNQTMSDRIFLFNVLIEQAAFD